MGDFADRGRDAAEHQGDADALNKEDERFWSIPGDTPGGGAHALIDEFHDLEDEELSLVGAEGADADADDEDEEPDRYGSFDGHSSRADQL